MRGRGKKPTQGEADYDVGGGGMWGKGLIWRLKGIENVDGANVFLQDMRKT